MTTLPITASTLVAGSDKAIGLVSRLKRNGGLTIHSSRPPGWADFFATAAGGGLIQALGGYTYQMKLLVPGGAHTKRSTRCHLRKITM